MMFGSTELVEDEKPAAFDILRRGIRSSPELKRGLAMTAAFAVVSAVARLVLPVLLQQTLDGAFEEGSVDVGFVTNAAIAALILIVVIYGLTNFTYRRVVLTSENTLLGLRLRTFDHVQKLSLSEHTSSRKGVLTARVTSDVETLAQFASWGAISWIVDSSLLLGALVVMFVYSWQLALLTILIYLPLFPILRWIQRRQLHAYNTVRTRTSDAMGSTSEAVTGAATIRAYGYEDRVASRLSKANDDLVDSQTSAHKYFSILAPTMDLFGGIATGAVAVVAVLLGPDNLTPGEATAFLFLVMLIVQPIASLGEVLDQTQTALAGWWKILQVMDIEIDVEEPQNGAELAKGAPSVELRDVDFGYRTGGKVLDSLSVHFPAGTSVAVVGETGSGKTTMAKLLARLADPTDGSVLIGGTDLREVSPESRNSVIRMVPQDGFLFDISLRENIRFGRATATDQDIDDAVSALGLEVWVKGLPEGLDTPAGERGEAISVGERQLIALIRAQLADAGLLILDEATSSVDPETEVRMANALERLSEGRTTISIAHRLSTAERSDLVMMMDQGKIVELGTHEELIERGGAYAALHEDWLGNTQSSR